MSVTLLFTAEKSAAGAGTRRSVDASSVDPETSVDVVDIVADVSPLS